MLVQVTSRAAWLALFMVVTVGAGAPAKPPSKLYGSLSAEGMSDVGDIKLFIRLSRPRPGGWEVELETRNDSEHAVFVLADPVRADGEAGPYLELDDTTLYVSARFYEGPRNYFLFKNSTRVKLKRLEPRASHVEKYTLTFPLRLTIPPYGDGPERSPKEIDEDRIKCVEASVGVLPDDEGVRDLLRRKPAGPFSHGGERVLRGAFKDRSLMDLQTIIRASYVIGR